MDRIKGRGIFKCRNVNKQGMRPCKEGFCPQDFYMEKETQPSGEKNRSLKALVTTETELIAMAPPAIIGFNVGPPKI